MRPWTIALYVVSAGAHALLAAGVSAIHAPPPPPAPVHIVVRDVRRPHAPEPPPPVEAPPPPVEAPPPTPAPTRPRAPTPAPAPAAAPPAAAPAPSPPPAFGLALSGASGAGGIAVPVGDPGGVPGGTGPRTRTAERRALEAAPAPAAEEDACTEAAVRPRALEMPRPVYTEAARAAAIEGRVRVEVHIGADGTVEDVRVVTPLDPGLDEAALTAVRGARFTPQTRCGATEPTTFTIGVSFSL
jgi:protein TonB